MIYLKWEVPAWKFLFSEILITILLLVLCKCHVMADMQKTEKKFIKKFLRQL